MTIAESPDCDVIFVILWPPAIQSQPDLLSKLLADADETLTEDCPRSPSARFVDDASVTLPFQHSRRLPRTDVRISVYSKSSDDSRSLFDSHS